MDIILKKDVENLGLEFDTVSVKPGYARNFLLPQGLALLATPKNKADLAATLEARKDVEAKLVAAANAIVEQLKKTNITIATKVGSGDKLFGSINNANLSEELSKVGVQVDKKYIKIPGNNIKRTGKFSAIIRLHREVEYNYEFEVVSDAPPVVEAPKPVAKPKAVEPTEETPAEEA
ncbi:MULTISPECIES: 50S ribosomal protein L9 [unclassified Kaistella]|uniref:50S ribosomal protein L9 n=1 Tax=unclassified Kaistella TaxID=2762626 RepID=UPI00273713F3|nr:MULTISPECIES: 50S ribosomal protein L9 [unclassified Kaistella]MCZ2083061.1 50S ribosomal protein L9 [Flavobacteriales bacterium]MDP2453084.1 50S ribosomal protein L9 [Kaistella sp. SH11-4b]MDP2456141.1 50S ribosomal protein L9 [Kaistella sp. SH40-3]MDP2458897.1 50S ribosomal protein L9 [Kaistella sp. SH19-2b]